MASVLNECTDDDLAYASYNTRNVTPALIQIYVVSLFGVFQLLTHSWHIAQLARARQALDNDETSDDGADSDASMTA